MSEQQTIAFEPLKIDLKIDLEGEAKKKTARAKKASDDKIATTTVTEADWEKVLSMKTSTTDQARLVEVHDAWRRGEILPQTKFSKTEAMRMYKRFAIEQRAGKLAAMVANTPANYILVQDEAALKSLCGYLGNEPIVAVDTETTGLETFGADVLVGMSLTLPKANLHFTFHYDTTKAPITRCRRDRPVETLLGRPEYRQGIVQRQVRYSRSYQRRNST